MKQYISYGKRLSLILGGFCFLWGLIFFTASTSIAQSDICKNQDKPIKIGVILPLSKEDSIYGIPNWFGIITAIRSHYLVREEQCKFQVILYDDEGKKNFAANEAKELLDAGVLAILGSAGSGSTEAILKNTRDQVTVISGQASATELKSDWFFRIAIPNNRLAESVIDVLTQKKLSNNRILLLYNEDNPFSRDLKWQLDKAETIKKSTAKGFKSESKSLQDAVDSLRPEDEVLIIITAIDGEAADILKKVKEHKGIKLEKLEIIVFEIHPAIYDTELFNNVSLFTSFDPFDDKRLSLARFKDNYEKSYKEVISICYDTGTQCQLSREGIEVELRQLTEQSPLDLHTLFAEFKKQVYDSEKANPKFLSNESPSYAVALGYDQANVLMQAVLSNLKDDDVNNFLKLKDPDKRKDIHDKVGKYDGALGTYFFTDKNHNGTNLPLLIQRKPQLKEPWLDSRLPQKGGFLHDNLQVSLEPKFTQKTGTVDTTTLGVQATVSFPFTLHEYIKYNPNISYANTTEEQQGVRTKIRTYAVNLGSFSFPGVLSFLLLDDVEPYIALFGVGKTKVEKTNEQTQLENTIITTVGLKVPISRFTKMLSLNLKWERQTKFSDALGDPSFITTISAGLEFSYPPSR